MEVSVGGIAVSLKRRKPVEEVNVGGSDSETLFNQLTISQSQVVARPDLMETICLGQLKSHSDVVKARKVLKEHGAVVVNSYFPGTEALAMSKFAFNLVDEESTSLRTRVDVERSSYKVVTDPRNDYYELANSHKPIIVQRLGDDLGMIDIFNFDRLYGAQGRNLKIALAEPIIQELFMRSGKKWQPRNLNVYVNRSITSTRGFHVDSYGSRQVKAFIYLTDVLDFHSGPYTYVLDSHKTDAFQRANIALTSIGLPFSPTDVPIVNLEKALPFLAPAGTLIISDQSGAHRGHPQSSSGMRAIAVLNFTSF